MSLRTALASLPDDRATATAVHEVVAYFSAHPSVLVEPHRLLGATGLSSVRAEPVLRSLAAGGVIHCDGDPRLDPSIYEPDSVLSMEVARFLRVAGNTNVRLQSSIGRFRERYGHL